MKSTFKPICLATALALSGLHAQARDVACPKAFAERSVPGYGYVYNSIAAPLTGSLQPSSVERGILVNVNNTPDVGAVPRKTGAFGPGASENRSAAVEVVKRDSSGRELFYSRSTRGSGTGPSYKRPTATSQLLLLSYLSTDFSNSATVSATQSGAWATLPPFSSGVTQLYVSAPRDRQYPYNYSGSSGVSRLQPTCAGITFF
jgi:hypothetical protein